MRSASRNLLWSTVVAITVTIVLVFTRYRQDVTAARERVAAGSQVVTTPCGTIEYAVKGAGPPLLVVHGAGGGYDQGLSLAEDLDLQVGRAAHVTAAMVGLRQLP